MPFSRSVNVNNQPLNVDVMALLLNIAIKINLSLGFYDTDYQTNKLQNVNALHCTLVLYIVPEGPELSQLEDIKG